MHLRSDVQPEAVTSRHKVQMTAANVMRTLSKSYREHCDTIHDDGGIKAMVPLTGSLTGNWQPLLEDITDDAVLNALHTILSQSSRSSLLSLAGAHPTP